MWKKIGQTILGCHAIFAGAVGLIYGKGGLKSGYTEGNHIRVAGVIMIYIGGYLLYDLVKKKKKKK